jgi:phage/plasmid-associated DNA primase
MNTFDTRSYCVNNGIVSFSCGIKYDNETKKKIPMIKYSWKKLTAENFIEHHDTNKSGFGIIMNLNNFIVIDCDIDKSAGSFPEEILSVLDNTCKAIVKTPNGKHYYFKTTKKITKQTGAFWNGNKVKNLDIIADSAFIFAPPTNYTRGDEIVAYQWVVGDLSTVSDLPDEIYQSIKQSSKKTENIISRKASYETIKRILEGLSESRFESYDSWLLIGAILHNDGIENGLELWDEMSQRVPSKYEAGACAKKWATFKETEHPATVSKLYYWLQQDNPTLYTTIKTDAHGLESLLINATHRNQAEAFYALKPNNFIYSPNANVGWYALQSNNVWSYQGKTIDGFKKIFFDTIAPLIEDLISKYTLALEEDRQNEQIAEKCKIAHKSLVMMHSAPFLENVKSWLQDLYTVRDIHLKMDCNPHLFAFTDKVFDFSICDYRDISPLDYISTTCGYKIPSTESLETGAPVLKKFLDSLFEDDDIRDYLLKTLAYSLCGTNYLQEFYIWKGRGGNGKGLLMGLLQRAMGNYINTIPISYFVKNSENKGAALPELAACKSARIVYSTEPDSNNKEKLKNNEINRLTGGDALSVRGLFKEPFTYIPQFTLLLQCNDCIINKVDIAIQRRTVVIQFPFEFKSPDYYNENVENHRLADRNIDTQLKNDDVRSAFIILLLEYFKEHLKGNKEILKPAYIKQHTNEFLNQSNPVAEWLYTRYNVVNDKKQRQTAANMLQQYNLDFPNNQLTSKVFGDNMSLLGYSSVVSNSTRYYSGLTLKTDIE